MAIEVDMFAAAQTGDRQALELLLVRLRPDIRRYARFQCHRASALEDVVQEALIVVYRRIGTVRSKDGFSFTLSDPPVWWVGILAAVIGLALMALMGWIAIRPGK